MLLPVMLGVEGGGGRRCNREGRKEGKKDMNVEKG